MLVLDSQAFCEVYDNIISDNKYGIGIYGSEMSIYGNIIENNEFGIWGEGYDITISNNHIENNENGLYIETSYTYKISKNNFINNTRQAKYSRNYILGLGPLSRNNFFNNYWDDWKSHIPRPIRGEWYYVSIMIFIRIGPFPSLRFDLFPAQEPYDIGV